VRAGPLRRVGGAVTDVALHSVLKQLLKQIAHERKEIFRVGSWEAGITLRRPIDLYAIINSYLELLGKHVSNETIAVIWEKHRQLLKRADRYNKKKSRSQMLMSLTTWAKSENELKKFGGEHGFLMAPEIGLVLDPNEPVDFQHSLQEAQESVEVQHRVTGRVICTFSDKYGTRTLTVQVLDKPFGTLRNPIPQLLDVEAKYRVRLKDGWDPYGFLTEYLEFKKEPGLVNFDEFCQNRWPGSIDLYDDLDRQYQQSSTHNDHHDACQLADVLQKSGEGSLMADGAPGNLIKDRSLPNPSPAVQDKIDAINRETAKNRVLRELVKKKGQGYQKRLAKEITSPRSKHRRQVKDHHISYIERKYLHLVDAWNDENHSNGSVTSL